MGYVPYGEGGGACAPMGHRQLASWSMGRLFRWTLALCLATIGALVIAPGPAQAAFSGTNGIIVYAGTGTSFGRFCAGRHQQNQLFEVPVQGSTPFQLTCTSGRDEHPFVSPDGSEVVFSNISNGNVSQLYTLSLASTGHRGFTQSTLVSGSAQASDDDASWSPAGDGTIIFQRTAPGSLSQLYTENVSNPTSATPVFSSPTGFSDTEPVYDPADPTLIAFVRPVDGHSHVFTYDLSTLTLTDISAQGDNGGSGNDSKPDFSPAGTAIVFQSDRACGYVQLYTMTVQGSDQVPVLPTTSRQTRTGTQSCSTGGDDPVYSPQGDQLAFDRQGYFSPGRFSADVWGGWGGSTQLSFVPVNASGVATGGITRPNRSLAFGVQPNWGPSDAPPAQTPEASFPILFPVLGAGVVGAALLFRRRRDVRRSRPETS